MIAQAEDGRSGTTPTVRRQGAVLSLMPVTAPSSYRCPPHWRAPMKPMNRFALTLLGSLICLSVAQEQCRATFDIFGAVDGQGADPLVDSYPFFIFPGKSRSVLIIFQSDAYEGVV